MHKKDGCVFVFYDNFLSLCKSQNIFPIEVRRALGISQSTMASWKSRGLTPKYETLSKIADYFGVSIDYLLGNTEQKEKASIPKDEREITLDDFTFAMQNETKDLTDMDKQILLSMARQLNDARKKKNGEPG